MRHGEPRALTRQIFMNAIRISRERRQYCNFTQWYCCNFMRRCKKKYNSSRKSDIFYFAEWCRSKRMRVIIVYWQLALHHDVSRPRDIYLGPANNWPVNGLLSVVWNSLKSRVVLRIEDCDCTAIAYRRSILDQWRREWRRSERWLRLKIHFFFLL